ncbi:MAG: hypothetical protein ACK56F_06460 [bacterium]
MNVESRRASHTHLDDNVSNGASPSFRLSRRSTSFSLRAPAVVIACNLVCSRLRCCVSASV